MSRTQPDLNLLFVESLPGAGEFYQYTAIDDRTRLRVLKIYPKNNQKTAIAAAFRR